MRPTGAPHQAKMLAAHLPRAEPAVDSRGAAIDGVNADTRKRRPERSLDGHRRKSPLRDPAARLTPDPFDDLLPALAGQQIGRENRIAGVAERLLDEPIF